MTMDLDLGGDARLMDPTGAREAAHGNPMFDYLTAFVPRRLKDLFRWSEYLSSQSAHIYAVVKKFGEYPITKFVYKTVADGVRSQYRHLFEKVLRAKGSLTEISFDKFVYGNFFISLYEPFQRMLECSHCQQKSNIRDIDYTFELDKLLFKFRCPGCETHGVGKVVDTKLRDEAKLRIIRWDPKQIDIEHNPVTGESVYYYQVPRQVVEKVRGGSKVHINGMPMGLLRAMQKRSLFRFNEGAIYHGKVPGPAGVEAHWGLPPVTAAIKLFLFAATLRRANEAIALEHITPFRVIHPQAASANGDPSVMLDLADWRQQVEMNYRQYRRDPLRIMFAPAPIGVQDIGGQGKALLTLGELQEAEKNIVLSLGVPMEFLSGGLGQTRGDITLRMIENQLQTHIEDLNHALQWIADRAGRFLGYPSIDIHLADFKMIDDTEKKQLFTQLWSQQKISFTTLCEMFEIDPSNERDQMIEDALADARSQMKLQAEMQRIQQSPSQTARQQAAAGQGRQAYDQQAMIGQADQIVQEMMQYDVGTRRSRMDSLKSEDIVMYALVRERTEQAQQDQEAQMKSQQQQPGAA
jgi:hypothetical protein